MLQFQTYNFPLHWSPKDVDRWICKPARHEKIVQNIKWLEEVEHKLIAFIPTHKRTFNKVKFKESYNSFHSVNYTVKPVATRSYRDQEFSKIKKGIKLCK